MISAWYSHFAGLAIKWFIPTSSVPISSTPIWAITIRLLPHFVYCHIRSIFPFRLLPHFVFSHFVYPPPPLPPPPHTHTLLGLKWKYKQISDETIPKYFGVQYQKKVPMNLVTQLWTGGALSERCKTYCKIDKKLDCLKKKFQNLKIGMCDYLNAADYLCAQWG